MTISGSVASTDYVIDYTSPYQSVLAKYEAGGLSYKNVYGLDRISTTVTDSLSPANTLKVFIQNDRLGSGRYASNMSGEVIGFTDMDEWGNVIEKTVPAVGVKQADILNNFTNHEFDELLGVYYAKARFYDPTNRRFLAVDPVKGSVTNPQRIVQYAYALNNPVNLIDLSGMETIDSSTVISLISGLDSSGINYSNFMDNASGILNNLINQSFSKDFAVGILSGLHDYLISKYGGYYVAATGAGGLITQGNINIGLQANDYVLNIAAFYTDRTKSMFGVENEAVFYQAKMLVNAICAAYNTTQMLLSTVAMFKMTAVAVPLSGSMLGLVMSPAFAMAGIVAVTSAASAAISLQMVAASADGMRYSRPLYKCDGGSFSGNQGGGKVRPEASVSGSKKHGVKWKEGPARAKATGNPQGQWAKSDLDYATQMANTLKPGESGYFDLPADSLSVVHMPDGTTIKATKMWIRNNGTGTWHGYPMS